MAVADEEASRIDKLVAEKERLIQLLRERRDSFFTAALLGNLGTQGGRKP